MQGSEVSWMGKWGCGPFDNDSGADFSDELAAASEPDRIEMLRTALAEVAYRSNHIDAGRAEVAFAAAAVTARGLDGGEEFQPENLVSSEGVPLVPDDLMKLAREAVDRLLEGDNDVSDDWTAEGGVRKYNSMLRRLRSVLANEGATGQQGLW
ncbi:DUF4259 domain-containing protein [Plantactinospora alkalitolerans]|nr:DUF4259 domain-containing protein [Plantactinospora alkalitolerans]